MECVHCAVRDESPHVIQVNFVLKHPGSIPSQSVRFVVDEVATGNVFLSVLRFSHDSTIPTMLHTDHQHVALSQMDKGAKQGNFLKGMPFRKSGEQ